MTPDRHLMETIKRHFARKSSAQLQEIVRANDQKRWSPEALAAAREVLQDRAAGRAPEPRVGEEEPPPPANHYDPGLLALGVLGGLLTGHLVIPYVRRDDAGDADPDLPVPFGPKMAWLALDTTDTEAVATVLKLREPRAASWAEGIDAAKQAAVFVTPPLADWSLAVGAALFPADRPESFVKPLLERLSRQFGDAQYFCTQRDIDLHVWARARAGRLVRGFGWLGERGLTLWDEGLPTSEERDLGFRLLDGRFPAVEQVRKKDLALPDESFVMQLACLWSVDPTTLDEYFKEPVLGVLGYRPEDGRRHGQ